MNTYIIHLQNEDGYEWVAENGETEIIEADSLADALEHLYTITESLDNDVYDELRKDVNAPVKNITDMHLPLKISVTEIPMSGRSMTRQFINKTLQDKVDAMYQENRKAVKAEIVAETQKQQAIDQLKKEAAKLGISVDDLIK